MNEPLHMATGRFNARLMRYAPRPFAAYAISTFLFVAGQILPGLVVQAIFDRLTGHEAAGLGIPALVALFVAWNVFQFGDWAVHRSYENYDASVALGRALPPDTLVQGKLANGLALENRIRPIFIGHEFGNYDDRKQRWDVRYILTYTDPAIGYEGDQIVDVLAAYPGWQIIMTFDVAETPSGHDRAALIEKRARH